MKGTCTSCDIHYTYDGFTVGGKSYRLTEERPYMMVTNRCVQRPFLRPFPRCVPTVHDICAIFRSVLRKRDIDDTEVRWTLQHASFHTQGLVLGIPPKILKKGLFLRWTMRYHREQMVQDVMPDTDLRDDTLFEMLNTRIRNNGMPSRHHRCVFTTVVLPFGLVSGQLPSLVCVMCRCTTAGPQHVRHMSFKKAGDDKVAYLTAALQRFEEVVILDGHEKVCRRVCQHQRGERGLHPTTGLNIPLQCSQWPDKTTGSAYCREHKPVDQPVVPKLLDESDDEEDEVIALRTRAKQQQQPTKPKTTSTVSDEGCTKTFVVHPGKTSGLLATARPCNCIIELSELIQPESTHDVLNCVHALREDGVVIHYAGYDNGCHCDQSVRKHKVSTLEDVTWFVDRYTCNPHTLP